MAATDTSLTDALVAALPEGSVILNPDSMHEYRWDRANDPNAGTPLAVVRVTSTEQVQAVVRLAAAAGVPIVPRGAGSSLSGGSTAIDGCIVLSLDRMREITVDPVTRTVVTQPGAFNAEVKAAAAEHGLWYPPDPASFQFCSIGGNVATNAGGLCCVKYGVTREAVLGLEVVLADGRVTRLGRRTVKGVAGYDLADMVVGSEGTLGIVTMARLRVRPLPAPAATAVAVFADIAAAGRAVAAVMATLTPSMLELMDNATIRAVEQFQPMGLDTSAQAILVAQTDATGTGAIAEADALLEICSRHGAVESYRSDDPQEADLLLGARRMAIPACEALGDWLLDDVSVPRSRLAEAMVRIQDIAAANDVQILTFGHAGDGNLHPTIVTPRGDAGAAARALVAFDAILDLSLALGGTITGEHGVGALKNDALTRELDSVAVALHARVKQAWDPAGILNPGKALPRW